MNFQEARKKLPQFNNLPDDSFIDVVHRVYYPDMDKADLAGRLGYKMPEPPVPERSAARAMGDLATQFGGGVVSGVRMMSDMFGADNAVSGGLRSAEEALRSLQSAVAQQDQQKVAAIMQEAEGKGWGEQIKLGLKAAMVAPGAMMAQSLGTAVPTLATAFIPGAGPAAIATRLGAGAAIGAAQGAGNIKGVIYEDVKRELAKANPNMPPEEIEAQAVEAQSFARENAGQIALGGVLGAATGTTGLERVVSGLRNGVTRAPAGMMARMLSGGATEAAPEFAQGGQEKYASNVAQAGQGLNVDPWSGVVAQGTMEGAAAVAPGAISGIPAPRVATPPANPGQTAANTVLDAKLVPEIGPMTRAANIATMIEAERLRDDVNKSMTGTSMADMLQGQADPLQSATEQSVPVVNDSLTTEPAADLIPDAGQMVISPAEQPLNMGPEGVNPTTGEVIQPPPPFEPLDFTGKTDEELDQARKNAQSPKIRRALAAELQARRAAAAQIAETAPATKPKEVSPSGLPEVSPKMGDTPATLPKDLAGAKERYNFGTKAFTPAFESDVDRAAFIASQKNPSKRDADYVKFAMDATGMTEDQVRAHGKKVRESIKGLAKGAEPGVLNVPSIATTNVQNPPPATGTTQAQTPAGEAPEAGKADEAGTAATGAQAGSGGLEADGVGENTMQWRGNMVPRVNVEQLRRNKLATLRQLKKNVAVSKGTQIEDGWANQVEETKAFIKEIDAALSGSADTYTTEAGATAPVTQPAPTVGATKEVAGATQPPQAASTSGLKKSQTTGPFDLYEFNGKKINAVDVLPEYGDFYSQVLVDSLPTDVVSQIQEEAREKSKRHAEKFPNEHTHIEPGATKAAPEVVKVGMTQGGSVHVKKSDLDSNKDQLPMYTVDGKRKAGTVARDNLDPTGEKLTQANAEAADNPLFDTITRKDGGAFATKMAALRELKVRGMADSHEVVPAEGGDGFVGRRKPQEAAPKTPDTAPKADRVVGQNENGETLMADAKGVRYYKNGGFKVSEPVRLRIANEGVDGDVVNRRDEFKTVEELAAEKPAAAATPRRIQPGEPGYTLAMARKDLQALNDRNGGIFDDDRVNDQIRQMEKLIKDMEAEQDKPADQPDPVKPARLPEAEAKAKAAEDPLTQQEKAAKAKMLAAAAKLAELLSKNTRFNITPEQEQKMLPIVIELFDGAMELGYVKFKQAARYVREFLANAIDQDAADSIPMDTLQGAYIATSRRHKDKAITPKGEVISVEFFEELNEDTKKAELDPKTRKELTRILSDLEAQKEKLKAQRELAVNQGNEWVVHREIVELDKSIAEFRTALGLEPATEKADTPTQDATNDSTNSTDTAALDSALAPGQPKAGAKTPARGAKQPRSRKGRGDDSGVRGAGGLFEGAIDEVKPVGDGGGPAAVQPRKNGNLAGSRKQLLADDFRPGDGGLTRTGSWFDSAKRNIDLIELAIKIEAEGRRATPDEQLQLSKYVGFGAGEIRNNLFRVPPAYAKAQEPNRLIWPEYVTSPQWKPLAERMAALPREWQQSVLQSTQYAHYTSEGVIRAVWSGIQRLGFTGGKVFEPGMGIGSFNMLMPQAVHDTSTYTGIEFDGPTALIAKLLSPGQNMLHGDFIKRKFPKDYFDVNVGNPPFSATKVLGDPQYAKQGFMLHDFFFAKGIDLVRPGGLQVFVTSKGTMDKQNDKARKYLSERADLLGAIRLPSTAFEGNAGTSVVTDVIFLRKRLPGEAPGGMPWNNLATVETKDGPTLVNEYYAAHPEMVLGQHRISGNTDDKGRRINSNGMGGERYTVVSYDETPAELDAKFAKAIENLPENVYSVMGQSAESIKAETAKVDFDPAIKRDGAVYLAADGTLMRVESGAGRPLANSVKLSDKDKQWFTGYVNLRGMVQEARLAQNTDGDWEAALKKLNKAYDKFRAENGPINDFRVQVRKSTDEDGNVVENETRVYKNRRLYREDYDQAILTSLEKINEAGEIVKGPFLLGRTIGKPVTRDIKTIGDALAVSLDNTGLFDLEDVAKRMKMTRDEAIDALDNQIYQTPTGDWQLADEYLSGNVVDKLEEAEEAARLDPSLKRNVEALKKIQPEKLGPSQISAKLGASWIPAEHVNEFAAEIEAGAVTFDIKTETWQVDGGNLRNQRNAGAEYGTANKSPSELLEAALNSRSVKVTKTVDKKTVVDEKATTAAVEALKKIKQKFKSWIWTDTLRAAELVESYNKRYNNLAPRVFDGSHLTLPGVSLRFKLHPHQLRAILRQVQTGDTYLAHAVGSGKTIEMIAGGMEQKRLGLIKKPMYVVPNHMLEQFSNEFMELYPLANIMVADDENFSADRRKAFVAAATLNAPDAVIITHDAFQRIGVTEKSVAPIRDEILADLEIELSETAKDNDQRVRRSQLQQQIEAVTQRFDRIIGAGGKDATITFEDMGVDFIYADEAHVYRKLDFHTAQSIKGIDPNGSKRALDMYVKTRILQKLRPGRSMVFASGTPVTNTMGELYTIMRFFAPDELDRAGISTFDGWARQFGEVAPALEPNAAGKYEVVERFAKFDNVPELMSRVRQFMDVLNSENLGALVKRPNLKGGKPNLNVIAGTPQLKAYMEGELAQRIEISKAWKPSPEQKGNPDPIVSIITDGRFAALDPRFFGKQLEPGQESILTTMAAKVAATYKASADTVYFDKSGKPEPIKGGTQIVFYNLGFGDGAIRSRGFDSRAAFTKLLTAGGIPRAEIFWFDDANTDAKKEAVFKDMRSGKIKVLIGSAKKMGTGVNVQKRLAELHYQDPPWFPADVEQPHGRIIRQGNDNKEVAIEWYTTKGTYQSTMWQMVARKQRFIDQAFTGDKTMRSMEDLGEASLFEQAAAVASGDPRAIQLAGLKQDVERFERLQAAHASEQISVMSGLRSAEWNAKHYAKTIARLEKVFKAIGERYYTFTAGAVGNATFTKQGEFGQAIKEAFNRNVANAVMNPKGDEQITLGTMGANISVVMEQRLDKDQKPTGQFDLSVAVGGSDFPISTSEGMGADVDATGLARRMINAVNGVEASLRENRADLTRNETDINRLSRKLGAPFEYQQEMLEKFAELKQLEEELRLEGLASSAKPEANSKAEPVPDLTAEAEFGQINIKQTGAFEANTTDVAFARSTQTETDAFKKWFGDSKVVDAEGKPLAVYHGTNKSQQGDAFTLFDTYGSNYGLMGRGSYFTDNADLASSYTKKGRGDTPTVYPVYLSIKNPINMDARGDEAAWQKAFPDVDFNEYRPEGVKNEDYFRAVEEHLTDQQIPGYEGAETIQDGLRSMGYDGITHRGGARFKTAAGESNTRHQVFIAFDPEQIKSAIGNNGQFDPANPDIRFSRNRLTEAFSLGIAPRPHMPVTEVQKAVDEMSAKWVNGPKIKVVKSPADLPIPAPADARGLIYGGTAYIVATNHTNRAGLSRTMAHEVIGHYGLWEILGPQGKRKFERSLQLALKSGNKPLNALSKKVRELYVDDDGNFNLSPAEEANEIAAFAVEEALDADGNFKPGFGFMKEVFAKIAQFLRDLGINIEFTNLELQGMLVAAAKNLEAGKRLDGGGRVEIAGDMLARAWHGTPYKGIDKFSTDKIGTGEGAQAYGWGLYFADRRSIAEHYRKNLQTTTRGGLFYKGKPLTAKAMNELARNGSPAEQSVFSARWPSKNIETEMEKRALQNESDAAEKAKQNSVIAKEWAAEYTRRASAIRSVMAGTERRADRENGQLYEVEIPEDSEMLLWDKPLSEQPAGILNSIQFAIESSQDYWNFKAKKDGDYAREDLRRVAFDAPDKYSGESLYRALSDAIGDKAASGVLSEFGIRGIKYLDGTSRSAGDGSYNYVIFSGDDVEIKQAMFARGGQGDAVETPKMVGRLRDTLNENFSHPGKLNWWHKTVGSQYNLAERNPAYKKVFDAAQSFINDVSYYGTEAANMAPKILPKLETLRDLTKSAISAADNKAVAAPVFEGTLSWGRDADGKAIRIEALEKRYEDLTDDQKAQMLLRKNVVSEAQLKAWRATPLDVYAGAVRNRFESTFLKPGVVWTDAELKSIFKLTDGQVVLYKEFRAATDTSLDNMAKAQMLREAGKDVADLHDLVMDAPDLDTAAQTIREVLLDLAKEDPDRADVLTDAAAGVLETAAKINELKKQGYAPLSRFGRYTVDVVVNGKREYFGLFETEADSNKMAAKMKMEFGPENVAQGTMSQKEFELFQGITPESLELFGNMMGLDSTGNEAQDKAFQTYLKLTKNNRSAMKRLIHRQGIAGYSEDVGRVLAAFVYSNARQTSAALHIGKMDEAITEIPKGEGELKDHAMELAEYIKQPREEAAGLRAMLFAQYLGGSVASAMINFTQPLTVSIPYLSQFGGLAKAGKAWAQAVKDMGRGVKLEPGLERALKDAEESGVVSPQEVHQLMAQARGAATLQSGDGTRKGDAVAMAKNSWTRATLAWGKLFGYAEQVNRRSTFIAAYRIAVDQGIANPDAFATKAVNETQFINNKANKMKFGRGAIGATLMTFKSYSLNWLELMHRLSTQDGKEGKLAAAYMMGALFLVAGAGGLPFAEDIEDLIDAIGQKMGYNVSAKKAKQEFLEDLFGKAGAQFVGRGMSGLPGMPVDFSGRMGMQNLVPGTGLLLEKRDSTRDVMEIVGPVGDLTKRMFQAAGALASGEVGKAVELASPTAVSNVIKGADMLDKGMYRDAKGNKVISTTDGEAVAKMAGFQPASVAQVQEGNFINQRAKDFYNMRVQDVRAKWAMGIFEGDQDKVKEAREMMADWNENNPDQKMTANMPAIIKKVREMRKDKAQRIADTAPKAMRAQMRADAMEAARQ